MEKSVAGPGRGGCGGAGYDRREEKKDGEKEKMGKSLNRFGRVCAVNYQRGSYVVVYEDRGREVTAEISAVANGEYRMPRVGDVVSVSHADNGPAAAVSMGAIWNDTNRPAEGFRGLWRKELGEAAGRCYERYDDNTGVYTQYVPVRTGRNCRGEIFDEAGGPLTLYAGGALGLRGKTLNATAAGTAAVAAGGGMELTADGAMALQSGGDASFVCGGDKTEQTEGDAEETFAGDVKRAVEGDAEETFAGNVTVEVAGTLVLTCGGVVVTVTPGGVTVEAPEVTIQAGAGDVVVDGISLVHHRHRDGGAGEPEKG